MTIATINRVLEVTAFALACFLAVVVLLGHRAADQAGNRENTSPRVAASEAISARESLARDPPSAPQLDHRVHRLLEDLALHD